MGDGLPNMGVGLPNMGGGLPNMDVGLPNMGVGLPNMGGGLPTLRLLHLIGDYSFELSDPRDKLVLNGRDVAKSTSGI